MSKDFGGRKGTEQLGRTCLVTAILLTGFAIGILTAGWRWVA